jgi:hypothetical protein
VTGDECPACSGREIYGRERGEPSDGVLFWSCQDCGFTWPQFTSPLSSWLVQASIIAAEKSEPRSLRSDR